MIIFGLLNASNNVKGCFLEILYINGSSLLFYLNDWIFLLPSFSLINKNCKKKGNICSLDNN